MVLAEAQAPAPSQLCNLERTAGHVTETLSRLCRVSALVTVCYFPLTLCHWGRTPG